MPVDDPIPPWTGGSELLNKISMKNGYDGSRWMTLDNRRKLITRSIPRSESQGKGRGSFTS